MASRWYCYFPPGGRPEVEAQTLTPSPACASLPDWGLTDMPCPSPNPGFSSLVVLSTKGQDPAIPQMSESEGLPWVGRLEIANDVGTSQPLPALRHGPASSPILLSHPDSASTVLSPMSGWKGTGGSRDQGSRDWQQCPCACTSKHAWVHTERRHMCHWAPLRTLCCCHLLQHESARTHRHTHTCTHTPRHVRSPTGTWNVHTTKKRWRTASSRQGSSEPPLPLYLHPPSQLLLGPACPNLESHDPQERRKMYVTCAGSASMAQLHYTTQKTIASGTAGRQQEGPRARPFIPSADMNRAYGDEPQPLPARNSYPVVGSVL